MDRLNPSLVPRNGSLLKVLGIARISTEHQDVRSLDDQEALYRDWLRQHTESEFDLHMIKGHGSGEWLDREDLLEAIAKVETSSYDLVLTEDLGRISRRSFAQIFCETCGDHETRLIAINDHIDTARDDWRILAGFASMRHEMYNADTAKRIRRSLRHRFEQGGVVQTFVYGYIKPAGAKKDDDIQKDPDAEPIITELFRRLEDGASYSEVADWLNEKQVKPGRWARSRRWTCSLVSQLVHNPILKGVRVRNRKVSSRINKTGRRKSKNAPLGERLERHVPHLAFIEPVRYDRLIRILDERNARFRRKGVNGIDSRKGVPKKRTIWPGQHIFCGICGRLFVYGGHGQKDHMMCSGARGYTCWNGITLDGPFAAQKLMAEIRQTICALPDFDPFFLQNYREEVRKREGNRGSQQQELVRRQASIGREVQNILAAVREAGHSSSLLDELRRLEQDRAEIESQQIELARQLTTLKVETLPSMSEIKAMAMEAFDGLSMTSPEFGRLLRRLIPRIVAYPFRLCDGGHPVLRAQFTLNLTPLLPPVHGTSHLTNALEQVLRVDLFREPQRAAFREPVMALTHNGITQREIASKLGITQPAVQDSVALSRLMAKLSIEDPYCPLTQPPSDYDRLSRHRHHRYCFQPLIPPTS